jgi:hypothetical protein
MSMISLLESSLKGGGGHKIQAGKSGKVHEFALSLPPSGTNRTMSNHLSSPVAPDPSLFSTSNDHCKFHAQNLSFMVGYLGT